MIDTNAILLSDTYKQCHRRIYPKGLTKLVSYWTPRRSMFADPDDEMIFFGLQGFIKEYLIGYFNKNFFERPAAEVEESYRRYMDIQIGAGNYDLESVMELHELGFLPIKLSALPEGTKVPMGIPCIQLTNTDSRFAWVTQWVECLLQASLWKPCCHATVGWKYHKLAEKYYKETVDDSVSPFDAMADFGMRGMSCMDEAIHASAAWLLSFNKTSTIPAIPYIEQMYLTDCLAAGIGRGAVSTEHSCQGANFAVDGDEITFIKRMLTELYPNTSFSMVSDTYDYWNLVNNLLPQCKKEIMEHNGKMLIRPDSGDIVKISVATVQKLWEIFGGTTNEKGYKVLDPHIGIIYGDGCQLTTVETIWEQLKELGFAANCITFGVGAFCFAATIEENGKMIALTRDTYGIAMKATLGVVEKDGEEQRFFIYKDPKTDTSHMKKSHRGYCNVVESGGKLHCLDCLYHEPEETLLQPVFCDGKLLKDEDFVTIRNRIYGGE